MIEKYNEDRAISILRECGVIIRTNIPEDRLYGACKAERLLAEKIIRLEDENAHIRAALAMSKDPCVYCQLPAEEMAKCRQGFPGCGRADDMAGCPHFAAEMGLHITEAEIKAAYGRIEGTLDIQKKFGDSPAAEIAYERCLEHLKSSFPHLFKETERS